MLNLRGMSKTHSVVRSFGYAFDGIKEAIKNEPNFRIHTIIALFALLLGLILKLSYPEWIILAFTIAFVLILELINTSLEAIVDIVSPQIAPKAKVAKDVIAAAVLISALLAVVIGILIFLPKIIPAFLQ
jgi:diacylglycerol kinase